MQTREIELETQNYAKKYETLVCDEDGFSNLFEKQ